MRKGSRSGSCGCPITRRSFTPAPSEVGMPRTTRSTARLLVWVPLMDFNLSLMLQGALDEGRSRDNQLLAAAPGRARAARTLRLAPRSSCQRFGTDYCGTRRAQSCLAVLARDRQAFGAHERDVRDAEEPEEEPQVRLDELAWMAWRVDAAAREGHDHPLASCEPLGTARRVAKGLACNRDPVDPSLQL